MFSGMAVGTLGTLIQLRRPYRLTVNSYSHNTSKSCQNKWVDRKL